jgi:hypothetical protein
MKARDMEEMKYLCLYVRKEDLERVESNICRMAGRFAKPIKERFQGSKLFIGEVQGLMGLVGIGDNFIRIKPIEDSIGTRLMISYNGLSNLASKSFEERVANEYRKFERTKKQPLPQHSLNYEISLSHLQTS